MKKSYFFIIILMTFGILMQDIAHEINVSVNIDSHGWIKIISKDNLSKKITNLKYINIYNYERNGIYYYNLEVPLDKKHKRLIYNLSEIGDFKLTKIESSGFLTIKNYSIKNRVIEINYNYNYVAFTIMALNIIILIIGLLFYTMYLNKLFKTKAHSIHEKSKILKKYTISFMIYSTFVVVMLLIPMFMLNTPDFVCYILNMSLNIAMMQYLLLLFGFIMIPPILSAKNMVRFFSSNNNKNKDTLDKEIKKSPIIIGLSLILVFAPLFIVFLMIIYNIPNLIIEPIKNEFYKLPMPLRVAFWITFYYSIGILFSKIINPILKRLKFLKPIDNKETINNINKIVYELSKKMNVKPFKNVEVIKSNIANARVEGIFKEKLIIMSKLLDIMSEDELKAIIAHELAHKKRIHIKIGFVGFILIGAVIYSIAIYLLNVSTGINSLFLFMVVFITAYILDYLLCRYISRKIEKDADLLATKIVEPKTYIKALSKIHFASYIPKEGILNMFMTHPSLKDRVKYIQKKFNISDEEVKKIMDEAYKEIEEFKKGE